MKLIYKDKILKEDSSIENLEEYRRKYKKEMTIKYTNLLDRYLKLENSRKYLIGRNPEDSNEKYLEKINLIHKDFIEELNSILEELQLKIEKIEYKDIQQGNIVIKTTEEILTFGSLNGKIRNSIPTMPQLKIID